MTSQRRPHRFVIAESNLLSRAQSLRFVLGSAAVAGALGLASVATAFMQLPDEPSPESGTAQVVAQGVVDVGDGNLRWRVAARDAPPPANAAPVTSDLGFLTVDSGVLLVDDLESGEQFRLPAGEAVLFAAGDDQARIALGSDVASYRELLLVADGSAAPEDATIVFESEPFAGTGDRHDLDLLQDALSPGATMTIPAGNLPALVVILAGAADVTTESGDVLSLGEGEAVALAGQLVVTAAESGASVAAIYTGPPVPRLEQAAATPQAGRVIETPEQPDTEAQATPATVGVATQPAGADEDADGDGLTASQEDEAGTDPQLVDTDEDGLSDGQEVLEQGTNPLAADSDNDGVLDGDEVAQGTDPNDAAAGAVVEEAAPAVEDAAPAAEEAAPEAAPATPGDSDGDGLEDAIELELGTDAVDIDTDDDGLTDGDEYYIFQTGTRNPDTDGDGVLDGTEIANGTDPNNPAA